MVCALIVIYSYAQIIFVFDRYNDLSRVDFLYLSVNQWFLMILDRRVACERIETRSFIQPHRDFFCTFAEF